MPLTADLSGTTVLVTGASSGIGAHCARVLAAAGARVVLAARRAERLAHVAAAIAERARAVVMDVTDEAGISGAFDEAERAFGPVTALVNNAGIATAAPALELDARAWHGVLATNVSGPWFVARTFAQRAVASARGGTIVNVASIAGLRPAGGLSAYGASKAALIHLTKTLALEWARYGIRVNAIAPGYIKTDLNAAFFDSPAGEALVRRVPQRRLGRLEDLDGVLLLLLSDASAYMTGSVIAIDGGHLLSSL
ncbi:MAG: SDR family NAD(P)-dependent oxidoreductase [Candidatus Velthaea sp.]